MGLGSSAALSVALVRALNRLFDESLASDQINGLALELEKFFHSQPSGIDNTVVNCEIPIYFKGMSDFTPLKFEAPCIFLLIDCGHRGITEGLIFRVREELTARPKETRAIFSEIGNTVEAARVSIGKGDGRELGRCLSYNHDLLRCLQLSTPHMDQIVEFVTARGALGAKMTGAGGGGYVIALFDDIPDNVVLGKASFVCLMGHGIDHTGE
jgi:mevalonate kinase